MKVIKPSVLFVLMAFVLALKAFVETCYLISKFAKSKTDWMQDKLESY